MVMATKLVSKKADTRASEFCERFKHQGLRMTTPRKIIVEVLCKANGYITAEEIYHQVHKENPGIGLATIYRTMNILTDLGVVTRFEFGEGKARFELAETAGEDTHFHQLVCTGCFKVIKYSDFSAEEKGIMQKIEKTLEKKYKFSITRHVVQFYGVCPECRKK